MDVPTRYALKEASRAAHNLVVDVAYQFEAEERDLLIDVALDVEHVITDIFTIALAGYENEDDHIIDIESFRRLMQRHPQ